MLGEWSVAIAVFVSPIGKPIVSLQAHSQMFPFPSVFMPFCCACWEKLEQKRWKMVLNLGFIFDQIWCGSVSILEYLRKGLFY